VQALHEDFTASHHGDAASDRLPWDESMHMTFAAMMASQDEEDIVPPCLAAVTDTCQAFDDASQLQVSHADCIDA